MPRVALVVAAGIVAFGWVGGHGAAFVSRREPVAAPHALSPDALRVVQAATKNALSGTAAVSIAVGPSRTFGPSHRRIFGNGSFDFRVLEGSVSFRQADGGVVKAIAFAPKIAFIRPSAGSRPVLRGGKSWVVIGLSGSEALTRNFPTFVAQAES